MHMEEIDKTLRVLRLPGIRKSLEPRALQADEGNQSFLDIFSMLLQDELDNRESRLITRRFSQSGLKERKSLSEFDWGFNPKIPKKRCLELATLKFIQQGENAVLIGPPGTGKSHVAKSITQSSAQNGYRVTYREAHKLFEDIFESCQINSRKKIMKNYIEVDLLVIDDLFLKKKMPHDAGDDLQEIVMERYAARKSIVITTNRIIEDWGKCLADTATASAILDRLLHHSHLLKFDGKSYRLKEAASRMIKKSSENE